MIREYEKVHGKPRHETMETILASVNRTDQKVDRLMQDLLEASSYPSSEGAHKRSTLFNELWEADWKPDLDTIGQFESGPSNEGLARLIQQHIVTSLRFASIESRDGTISETYKSTYEWILDPNGLTGFVSWMEKKEGLLYWITGKAGSGKSTLMKYLVHHESTMLHLEKWAGELPLLFSHFYFWDATTDDLQHSKEGLIRTLLWQCLSARLDLVQKVVPRRWAAYNALRGWEGPVPEWSWREIEEIFQNLVSFNNSSFRLVMFIDGLDEFGGEPATMIQWIKDIVEKSGVKVCVGSRPWTAFSDAFEQYPSLTMQTLTAPDIKIYIDGYFTASRAFNDWKSLSPAGAEALHQGLIEKAGGVFLWVHVVVKELMHALENGRNLHDLSTIVDSLPTDMMELYTKIYSSAEEGEAKRAALYFTLLKAAMHRLKSYELWYIEEETALDANDKPAWVSMQRLIKRRLDSSTRGMIEYSGDAETIGDGHIEFHHRTAKEWLSLPEVVPLISAHVTEYFDARLLLVKGYRARMAQVLRANKEYSERSQPNDWHSSSTALSRILYYASQVAESPPLAPALIKELETVRETVDKMAELFKVSDEEKLRNPLGKVDEFKARTRERPSTIFTLPARAKNKRRIEHSTIDRIEADLYEVGHWSLAEDVFRDSAQSCFTVLAAQYAVYPYVMAQVMESPDLLEEKDDRISFLHAAIFGSVSQRLLWGGPDPVDYRLRLRLIEALLDSGASVRGRPHAPQTFDGDGDIYYLHTIQQADKNVLLDVGPEEYWDEVRRLLTKKRRGARFRQLWKAVMYTNL